MFKEMRNVETEYQNRSLNLIILSWYAAVVQYNVNCYNTLGHA